MKMIVKPGERDINKYDPFGQIDLNTQSLVKAARNISDKSQLTDLIERKALFVSNHSGGKDSQTMLIYLKDHVPHDQILIIHAELPGVEWDGTEDKVREYAGEIPVIVTKAKKTFFEMVDHRQMYPSPQYRQCTSDLKRGPIEKAIRHYLKANQQFGGLIVNCMGMRAQESTRRSKLITFKFCNRNSKAGREWYDWLPIHDMLENEVFETIAAAGEKPHWAYKAGMSRLSCCFCIMSSKGDLITAAKLNPSLYKKHVDTEKRIGQSMMMPIKGVPTYLEDYTGIKL